MSALELLVALAVCALPWVLDWIDAQMGWNDAPNP